LQASTCAGGRDILAREPAADESNSSESCCSDAANIVISNRLRPMLLKHRSSALVALDLPQHGAESGALETEVEATNAREQ